ncbi:PHD-finger domain-containing protein [Colletotrichum karsti]|uniref:PHD-finger domain-containing protein n=1 Tax=Colletotrichum karsti TaxID=1095194 RepID=A0A9P6I9F0_9PEZI|nr:PHD-finger domain-containing protein [Colletotrichum karsti]KAF9879608.1 PHD-finger domain-containing protein [Colletotrichum karsti]
METTEKPAESHKMGGFKKKGTATKKGPKRPKGGGASKPTKSKKPPSASNEAMDDPPAEGSDEEIESDNGPYCICRGPDDHRFMISCDMCEDWFHGECINISKDVGENLIERFVCPNCTDGDKNVSLFKKLCGRGGCKRPARLYDGEPKSAFCSDEHKQAWWEAQIMKLPKKSSKDAGGLTREDLVGLLNSPLASIDAEGNFKVNTRPFAAPAAGAENSEARGKALPPGILTDEEEGILKESAADRKTMGEKTALYNKMIQLLDMASERRKTLIASKQFEDSTCGYDYRLDQVGVIGPFNHWVASDEAKEIFKAGSLDVGSRLTGEDKNICDKKRCKVHQGWYSMHTRDVKYEQKLLAGDAKKLLDNEQSIKTAAVERKLRKEAEHNTVQRVNPDGTLGPAEVL